MRTERSVFRGYAETSLNFVPEKIQLRRGNLAEPNREREREERAERRARTVSRTLRSFIFLLSFNRRNATPCCAFSLQTSLRVRPT